MGFDVEQVVAAFEYVGIDKMGGEDYELEEAYMGDITARLFGEAWLPEIVFSSSYFLHYFLLIRTFIRLITTTYYTVGNISGVEGVAGVCCWRRVSKISSPSLLSVGVSSEVGCLIRFTKACALSVQLRSPILPTPFEALRPSGWFRNLPWPCSVA